MSKFILISRTLLSMSFKKGIPGRRGYRLTFVGTLIFAGIFSAFFTVGMALSGSLLKEYGIVAEVSALLFSVDFLFTLIFGTIAILSYLYYSKDNEFFLSLPVSANAILYSKLTVIYVEEALFSVVFTIPGAIALAISAAQPATFYVMALIGTVFVPFCAILIGALISVPITFIAGFFRNRGAVTTILLLAIFAILMTLYFVFSYSLQNIAVDGEDSEAVIDAMYRSLQVAMYVIYPIYCLTRFGTLSGGFTDNVATSAVINLLIFMGTVIVLSLLLFPISMLFYKRTMLRQAENASPSKVKAGEYVGSSTLSALVKKEFRLLFRNASFAFQCLAGVVMAPLFGVLMFTVTGGMDEMMDQETITIMYSVMWPFGSMIALMMLGAMNMTALTAVTREGKTFIYSKLMPVPYSVQLNAKRISALLPGIISAVLTTIVMTVSCAFVYNKVDILCAITTLLMLIAAVFLSTEAYLLRDMKKPRLDWVTPRDAIKGNLSTILPTVIGMLVSMAAGIINILVSAITNVMYGNNFGVTFSSLLIALIFAAFTFLAHSRLVSSADRCYDRLSA